MTKQKIKQWQARIKKQGNAIDYESTLDTLIEHFGNTPSDAYTHLKKGLELLQKDLDDAGIHGHWSDKGEAHMAALRAKGVFGSTY